MMLAGAMFLAPSKVFARPAADDFLNPQQPGPRLTLMPFVGPGFRATYDHRFTIEEDMSELRTQLIGTVAVPFAEVSANADVRFFVSTFGASIGYHDEWHLLQFNPDPNTGRDRAGQERVEVNPNVPGIESDPRVGYSDLHRDARAAKDENADVRSDRWFWYEGRWGFVTPAPHFMGVSTLAARHDGRPNVTYDWENATVLNGGWHWRWEGYALLRDARLGFIGPALRALYVPRNRTRGDVRTKSGLLLSNDSACQPDVVEEATCVRAYEFEFQYGILAGIRPNWVDSSDLFLVRAYTTAGLKNELFGTHLFRYPLQLLVAYMVDVDL